MKIRNWFISPHKLLQRGITHHSLKDVQQALRRGADVEKFYKVVKIERKPCGSYDRPFADFKVTRTLTPLIHALMLGDEGDIEIISALLKITKVKKITTTIRVKPAYYNMNKSVTFHDKQYSPLKMALKSNKNNSVDVVKLLVQAGYKIDDDALQHAAIDFLITVLQNRAHCDELLSLCQQFAAIGLDFNNPSLMEALRLRTSRDNMEPEPRFTQTAGIADLMLTAIQYGSLDVFGFLFEHSQFTADDHIKDTTLLACAAFYNQIDIMKQLIKQGAEVNQYGRDGRTPLLSAIADGNIEAVKLLLMHGADVNQSSLQGDTPLMMALEQQTPQTYAIVASLLNAQADIKKPNLPYRSPLNLAIEKHDVKLFKMMIQCGQEIDWASAGERLFMQALDRDITAIAAIVINKNCHLKFDDLLLMQALRKGNITIATLLIEKNDHLKKPNTQHETPLHIAASKNFISIAELLVKKCSKSYLNSINEKGETALFIAASEGHAGMVKLLLQKGAKDIANRGFTAELVSKDNHIRRMIADARRHKKQPASSYSPTLFEDPVDQATQKDMVYSQSRSLRW